MARSLNEEEKLLVRRAYDKLDICRTRYDVTFTGFLNEREQDILLGEIRCTDDVTAIYCGGYENAERRLLAFVPEYCELVPSEILSAIRCSYYKDYELTHRDFLGALMGLGIERQAVGDIIVDKKNFRADIIVKKEIVQFLLSEFVSAGRAKLNVSEIGLDELCESEIETEIFTDTVASPRLDAIVSSGFGISRENAAALVRSGKVYADRRLIDEPDKTVVNGALINALGYGKFRASFDGGKSKKGRLFIKIEKYV